MPSGRKRAAAAPPPAPAPPAKRGRRGTAISADPSAGPAVPAPDPIAVAAPIAAAPPVVAPPADPVPVVAAVPIVGAAEGAAAGAGAGAVGVGIGIGIGIPEPAPVGALDIALCFDTTGSMGPCIYQVRKQLAALIKELFENMPGMGIPVRAAVIAHADYDAEPYVVEHADFSDRAADVVRFITGVRASSGAWNEGECYEAALRKANELAWRADATKVLVVVGDDLPHEPDFVGNVHRVNWRVEARALADKGVAIYAVQCPCLNIPRAKHFYEALAGAHPKGAYTLLTQFGGIVDMLLALVFHARGDAPAIEGHERALIAAGRYNRGLEVAFNGLLAREDARRAAFDGGGGGGGAGAGAGGGRRGVVGGFVDGRAPVPAGRFQRLTVEAKQAIRDFVRETCVQEPGAVFAPGRGFYELTKPEDVSAKKEVVLEHVASGEMFSGTDAREMLGIPAHGDGHVTKKSVPDGYRAFIQSTSYNRVLMPDTRFLYEMT